MSSLRLSNKEKCAFRAADARMLGLCVMCRCRAARERKKTCQVCADRQKKLYIERKVRGVCVRCEEKAVSGTTLCGEHTIVNRIANRV